VFRKTLEILKEMIRSQNLRMKSFGERFYKISGNVKRMFEELDLFAIDNEIKSETPEIRKFENLRNAFEVDRNFREAIGSSGDIDTFEMLTKLKNDNFGDNDIKTKNRKIFDIIKKKMSVDGEQCLNNYKTWGNRFDLCVCDNVVRFENKIILSSRYEAIMKTNGIIGRKTIKIGLNSIILSRSGLKGGK
jgi:hypothetical protein